MDQRASSESMAQSQVLQEIRALLLNDAGALLLGAIIAVVGMLAISIFCIRRKPKARLLLWFGVITLMYGIRRLLTTETIPLLINAPDNFWRYLIPFISYVIVIPFALFFEEVYGKGWKSSLRALIWILSGYALAAILLDVIRRSPESLPDPVYLFFIGLGLALFFGRIFAYHPPMFQESRAIFIGILVFIGFVVNEHLVDLEIAPWTFRAEAFGYFMFVVLLGFVAVRRSLIQEQKLAALQHEMAAAWRIQTAILPRELPAMGDCSLAVRYVPMASVAGDFYDFAVLDDRRIGILIADVAGHGVPAALIASMVKVGLSSLSDHWSEPAAVVAGLNQVLCKQETGQLVTAGYLLLDLPNFAALYSGAAHPPLLLWRSSEKTVLEVQENGLPLGFRANETYSSASIRLASGDRILMYTDGILEAANPAGELFGKERFKDFVVSRGELPAEKFADCLLQNLASWSGRKTGSTQEDDLTLIVVDIA